MQSTEYTGFQDGRKERRKQGLACRVVNTQDPRMAVRKEIRRTLLSEQSVQWFPGWQGQRKHAGPCFQSSE